MLRFFLELKSSYEFDLGQDLVLVNNKESLIDQKIFFYKSWFQKGIFRIHDCTFVSYGDFIHKYDLKCNFLQYLQVASAIPRPLAEKAKQNLDAKFTFSPVFFQLSPSINVKLLKMKSKDYYWFFQNTLDAELKEHRKWTRDLQTSDIEFNVFFKNLKGMCKEKKKRILL